MRWYRNVVSRGSAVQSVALVPISAMKLWASSDKGPRVSAATGKKTHGWLIIIIILTTCNSEETPAESSRNSAV